MAFELQSKVIFGKETEYAFTYQRLQLKLAT